MALDPVRNFAITTITDSSFTSSTTTFNVANGSVFPSTSEGIFNLVLYNSTDYTNPSNAYIGGQAEIIKVNTRSGNSLTLVSRGQEGTTAINSIIGKTYQLIQAPTKNLRDLLELHLTNTSNPHGTSDSNLTVTDITTNNVSITKHGFVPKAPNDTNKVLKGDGNWGTTSISIGGTDKQIQFNDANTFNGEPSLIYDKIRNTVFTNYLFVGAPPEDSTYYNRVQAGKSYIIAFSQANSESKIDEYLGTTNTNTTRSISHNAILTSAVDNAQTSILVNNTSDFANSGYIKIDSEIMQYTSKTSTTFTVVRGVKGTTATSHINSSKITMYVDSILFGSFYSAKVSNPTEDISNNGAITISYTAQTGTVAFTASSSVFTSNHVGRNIYVRSSSVSGFGEIVGYISPTQITVQVYEQLPSSNPTNTWNLDGTICPIYVKQAAVHFSEFVIWEAKKDITIEKAVIHSNEIDVYNNYNCKIINGIVYEIGRTGDGIDLKNQIKSIENYYGIRISSRDLVNGATDTRGSTRNYGYYYGNDTLGQEPIGNFAIYADTDPSYFGNLVSIGKTGSFPTDGTRLLIRGDTTNSTNVLLMETGKNGQHISLDLQATDNSGNSIRGVWNVNYTGEVSFYSVTNHPLFLGTSNNQHKLVIREGSATRIGIGVDNPATSSILDITSTTSGFLVPRMTATQRDAIVTPIATGLIIYNTDTNKLNIYSGGIWNEITSSSGSAVTSVFGRTGAVVAIEGDYSLNLLSDVIITTPTSQHVLLYNGTSWVNGQASHTNLLNIGTNTHAQIDTHIGNTANPHGTSITQTIINLSNYQDITQITTPANPSSGTRRLFVDSTDGKLKVRTSGGTSVSLEESGGGSGTYLGLSDTPSTFTASSIPYTNSGATALLHSVNLIFDNALKINTPDIRTTSTDGLVLSNNTSSDAVNTVQMSPRLRLRSHSWQSLDKTQDWIVENSPTTSGIVRSSLTIKYSDNGGAYDTISHFESSYSNYSLGKNSLPLNTTIPGNIAIGNLTLRSLASGSGYNIAIGNQALELATSGQYNIGIGLRALNNLTTGEWNTAIGWDSQLYNVSGNYNVGVGIDTVYNNNSGSYNTGIGMSAGRAVSMSSSSSFNYGVFVGSRAGHYFAGSRNVYIGFEAGLNSGTSTPTPTSANDNIFIGYQAGYNETSSNKLYIENSNSSSPLIYGEFDTDLIKINGTLGIGVTPTAVLHLKAGTATANTAPLKLTAGTNLTTVENGAFEFDGTNLYFTTGGVRKTVSLV